VTVMHTIIADHPDVAAVTEQQLKLNRAREIFQSRRAGQEKEHRRRHAEWLAASDVAVLEGMEPPPAPDPLPDVQREAAMFVHEGDRLRERLKAIFAAHGPDLEARLRDREAKLLRQVERRLGEVDVTVAELAAVIEGVRLLRTVTTPGTDPEVYEGNVDVLAVVEAAVRGRRLTDAQPVELPLRTVTRAFRTVV